MNVAQHASNILDAWHNAPSLEAALESASHARIATRPDSNVESERGELLESIVDHLRLLASRNELTDPAKRNGALTLLSHLSAGARMQEASANSEANIFSYKNYNCAAKAPK